MGVFVPLGAPDFNGGSSKGYIGLKYSISKKPADKVELEVRKGGNTFFKVTITDSSMLRIGSHEYQWDGFNDNGILDTAFYTSHDFNFLSRIYALGQVKFNTVKFKCAYEEVDWVDVKIDKNAKRIDVTLRVNLKDGGETGTDKDCKEMGKARGAPVITICPWDKIPDTEIKSSQPIIKSRTKKFKELKQLALDGLSYHWGRNQNHLVSKNISINGLIFEVYVNPVNVTENAMDDIELTYNTNNIWGRSNNPGSVTGLKSFFANLAEYIPYVPLNETIFYNIGYVNGSLAIQSDLNLKKDNWIYLENTSLYKNKSFNIDREFCYTSAHELGHTILKSYSEAAGGSEDYSYKHKGSSGYSETLPVSEGGSNYPNTGEIDLMKYFNNSPRYFDFDRISASTEDVLGLIWLTKIELK